MIDDTKNLIVAILLSVIILTCWQYFVEAPRKKAEIVSLQAKAAAELRAKREAEKETSVVPLSREARLAQSPRIAIRSDRLQGSLALKGLRLDDLALVGYKETLAPDSPQVTLFSPAGADDSYFAEIGWLADPATVGYQQGILLPSQETLWAADGKELTPQHPVTLSWKNGKGVRFTAKIALDDKYMFTITAAAKDAAGKPIALRNYAYINRVYDVKDTKNARGRMTVQEGPLGVFDGTLSEATYKKLSTEPDPQTYEMQSGWLGISDTYWLSAIIPPAGPDTVHFSYYASKGLDHFQVDSLGQPQPEAVFHFFAGAKELGVLDGYAQDYNIALFDRAVDFGWFYFLTKPIFLTLNYFHKLVGNFGVAILLLTVVIKLLLFPLANKSFKAMSQMKALSPKMAEIRERCKDDKLKMNQEIMDLYKREKINPASGCLPLFIQIPVFFSLLKVLYVSIEMRHAPFFGWIHDLSASDPTNLFTLFGLAPWGDPVLPLWVPFLSGVHLHVGVWPVIMSITMLIQQHQSPPPPDPMQAKMMKLLPFFFLFLFSSFPAGVVIYWCFSNTFTILQQWYITTTHAAEKNRKK